LAPATFYFEHLVATAFYNGLTMPRCYGTKTGKHCHTQQVHNYHIHKTLPQQCLQCHSKYYEAEIEQLRRVRPLLSLQFYWAVLSCDKIIIQNCARCNCNKLPNKYGFQRL